MPDTIPPRLTLPIDDVLPSLVAALRSNSSVVLRAPTGAGKTTRVPPALLDAGLGGSGRIVMLEPRRIAARAAARRMATERGTRLGGEIGYQVRFDQQASRDTRILVVTEGILLQMLQDDPCLERIGVVVFDEFHERSLNSDVALGMVRRVQQTVRQELRIVVMSATLAAQPIASYLGGCPVVESEGRLHPVEIHYLPQIDTRQTIVLAAQGVEQLLGDTDGDLLVFLPGVGEIRQLGRELASLAERENLAVMELFGDLPPEKQDAVLSPSDRRKVVLATNVAETSITIDGVTGVVDTGLARVLQFDPHVGLDRLEVTPISRSSADQRAGRAGRTRPGVCLRLWSEQSHRLRADAETPEVRRVDLAGPVLLLHAWGESDIAAFPWFEAPPIAAIEQAEKLLRRLDALSDNWQVTELGRQLARLPTHPRLARMLIEGARLGQPGRVALAAALLSERDPFSGARPRGERAAAPRHWSRSDLLDRVTMLEEFEAGRLRGAESHEINRHAAHFVLQARDQLVRLLERVSRTPASGERREPLAPHPRPLSPEGGEGRGEDALQHAVLVAFPDRLARRREPGSPRAVMVGGKGIRLAPQSAVSEAELFVCLDVDATQSEVFVRMASAVEREWLPAEHLRNEVVVEFDETAERVVARRRVMWHDLTIEESTSALPEDGQAANVLADAAANRFDRVFPVSDRDLADFIARVRSLVGWRPEHNLPAFDEAQLRELLPQLCAGRRTFAELRQAPWLDFVQSLLTPVQRQAVEREAPERIEVPSGSKVRLQYEPGRPPVLAVRIQELFGLRETPRIAAGRVPVLLHLLAPNMRPEQVTDDLRSFWDNVYPKVRSELRRRYPKHSWPEDPWNATPQCRPGRRS
jgi:ATP-dependent helicase HrpB